MLNVNDKHYRLRVTNLRFPIIRSNINQVIVKENKLIVKIFKEDHQIWGDLRKSPIDISTQNKSIEEGCLKMIDTLRRQGKPALQKDIALAIQQAQKQSI